MSRDHLNEDGILVKRGATDGSFFIEKFSTRVAYLSSYSDRRNTAHLMIKALTVPSDVCLQILQCQVGNYCIHEIKDKQSSQLLIKVRMRHKYTSCKTH